MTIKVYGLNKSRAFRVLWMLEELAIPYIHKPVYPHDKELVKISNQGRIPIMVDGNQVFVDSTAILNYIGDKHNQLTFEPGSRDRAKQDSLTHFILCEIEYCCWTAAKHSFVLPKEMRIKEVKTTLKWEFNRSISELSTWANYDEFLMGSSMTIPDIILTHCLDWAKAAKFDPVPQVIQDYYERMTARIAYKKVAQLN